MHTPLHSELNFRALPNCEPPISNPLSKTHTPYTCWHGFWMQESKTAVHMVSVCELPHVIFFSNANHYIITAIFPFCNIMFACLFIVNIFLWWVCFCIFVGSSVGRQTPMVLALIYSLAVIDLKVYILLYGCEHPCILQMHIW